MIISRNPFGADPLVTKWAQIIVTFGGAVIDPREFLRAEDGQNGSVDFISRPLQLNRAGSRVTSIKTERRTGAVTIKRAPIENCVACKIALQRADWWTPEVWIQKTLSASVARRHTATEMAAFARLRSL